MAVSLDLGDTAEVGETRKVGISDAAGDSRIVSDGKRLLVNRDVSGNRIEPIQIIRNWAAGLPD